MCAPCDLCSHNILLYEDGHAVVADFGGKRHYKDKYVHFLSDSLSNLFSTLQSPDFYSLWTRTT